jgi:8-oxo-dGTP pyrophosphatase MutT (NUDIX family)
MIVFRADGKLLVNFEEGKKEKRWKFPQGGVEKGESYPDAVARELFEEVNITHFSIIGEAAHVNTYDWPLETQQKKGFRGQEQHFFLVHAEKPEEMTSSPA